jgi:hypothetical protein
MKQPIIAATVIVLVLALAVTALALGGNDPEAVTQDSGFVGLSLDEAIATAEAEDRPWRIARQDDEGFALTADLWPGRVTFEVDDGIVTVATIEEEFTPPADYGVEDAEKRAGLLASALLRLAIVDNGFGGQDVFDDLRVLTTVDGEPLTATDRDFIQAALAEVGSVTWIDDFEAEVAPLFDAPQTGVALLAIDRIELLDDRAEVEVRLWCGSLCGVFLTYEAAPSESGWEITGTVGPIAMS